MYILQGDFAPDLTYDIITDHFELNLSLENWHATYKQATAACRWQTEACQTCYAHVASSFNPSNRQHHASKNSTVC